MCSEDPVAPLGSKILNFSPNSCHEGKDFTREQVNIATDGRQRTHSCVCRFPDRPPTLNVYLALQPDFCMRTICSMPVYLICFSTTSSSKCSSFYKGKTFLSKVSSWMCMLEKINHQHVAEVVTDFTFCVLERKQKMKNGSAFSMVCINFLSDVCEQDALKKLIYIKLSDPHECRLILTRQSNKNNSQRYTENEPETEHRLQEAFLASEDGRWICWCCRAS